MRAFELALDEGADGVELDVRLDRDGDVVVCHDATLARVTEGRDTRAVQDLGRRELAEVDLGGGERVPRLAEVFSWAKRRGARVNVELKKDVPNRAALVLAVFRMAVLEPRAAEWMIFSSFDPQIVAALARVVPWVASGWLVESGTGVPGRSLRERLVGASALHPQASLVTRESIAPWQRAELPVNVWTVNDPDEARRLAALGVDTIISDVPGAILKALGKS